MIEEPHWSTLEGSGPMRQYLMKYADDCGDNPNEVWEEVRMTMRKAWDPSCPEMVVHAMYRAVTKYVSTHLSMVYHLKGPFHCGSCGKEIEFSTGVAFGKSPLPLRCSECAEIQK